MASGKTLLSSGLRFSIRFSSFKLCLIYISDLPSSQLEMQSDRFEAYTYYKMLIFGDLYIAFSFSFNLSVFTVVVVGGVAKK